MLKLHSLKPAKGSKKKKKRVGRGNSSGHGTYSTRGIKGQRSRSGGKKGLKLKGLRLNLLNIPKMRGFKSLKPKKVVVNLSVLDKICKDGDIVNPDFLLEKKVVETIKPGVKILANGKISKKITIENCFVSNSAKEKIEKVGGVVK